MRRLLLCVCLCIIGSEGLSTKDFKVEAGAYPYMAIVYYMDDTILENGKRFMRSAILVRPDWLVSAAVEVGGNTTFPHQTLVARAGADDVDKTFTLDEDSFEQDREIIQVVQPTKGGYETLPCLLKTLVAFNTTAKVAPTALADKMQDYTGRSCFSIVYGYSNNSGDLILMKWLVEALPRSACNTSEDGLICASYNNSDEFGICPRNRGGPLVCEDTVVGLQSYLGGCQQPHLHFALAAWTEFIHCGVKEQCAGDCKSTCTAVDKDPPATTRAVRTEITTVTEQTDAERRNAVENATVAINETSFEYLKEEIKRTSDIVASLETDTTSVATETTEDNATSTMTSSTPTRTVELKMRNDMTKVNTTKTPKKAVARTRNLAVCVVKSFVLIPVSIVSIIFM